MHHNVFKRRVYFVAFLILIVSIGFIFELSSLHFSDKIFVSVHKKNIAKRGYIKDKNGSILAMSVETNSLFANPKQIRNADETARFLSLFLKISEKKILKLLKKNRKFVWIKRKLSPEIVKEIKKVKIKGLYFKKEYIRSYPNNFLASNILGFVDIDNLGLEGIEYRFNNQLLNLKYNIYLTIDKYIQKVAENELSIVVKKTEAKQGSVLIYEIGTGRILAMAKYPTYNSNLYYKFSQFSRRNFSIIDSFEPGSTMKILSLSSMLEHIPNITKKEFLCKGAVKIGDTIIGCTKIHGNVKMDSIIEKSCNVGIIQAAEKLKNIDLYKTYKKYGFGEKTGIELPGESKGILRSTSNWSGLSKYSMSIGHEMSATSLQLVSAFGAIANKGIYVSPTIIEKIEDENGDVLQEFYSKSKGSIINSEDASKLMDYMEKVVNSGTAVLARSKWYTTVGKTGTSKKFIKNEGYSDRLISSFIGITPKENPRICMIVIIDEPKGRESGGRISAPIYKKISEKVLPYLGVKNQVYLAKPLFKSKKIKARIDWKKMPNLIGINKSELAEMLSQIPMKSNLKYNIFGNGSVFKQNPVSGSKLYKNSSISIFLKE